MLYGKLKEYRVLVTFPALTQELAAERVLKHFACPFATFPTPRQLRAGCNTAMCFPLERKELVEELIDDGVVMTGIYEAKEEGFFPLAW